MSVMARFTNKKQSFHSPWTKSTQYGMVKNLRMPDVYITKLDRHVNVNRGKLFSMKSHDYHVFIVHLF